MTDDPSSPSIVRVELGDRSYDIMIGADLLSDAGQHIKPLAARSRVFVLTDTNVAELHLVRLEQGLAKHGLAATVRIVPAGEATKSLTELGNTLDWLISAGASRDDVLIAFGGGVIGDLAGLTAALMKRGMRLVQVPTTLLALVDSSVGGKTAVNTAHGKNLIGSFYQPALVLSDIDVLTTLPERERRAGYAEIVKYALIDDPAFFDWLERHGEDVIGLDAASVRHAVSVSCTAKARIVAGDERENGTRALLNLGHTFAHALEAANGYGPDLLHGEAVGCGMALAMRYSQRLGLMSEEDAARSEALIAASGLVTRMTDLAGGPYRPGALTSTMQQDKKSRGGKVPLILARGIGQSFIQPDADLEDLKSFLENETSVPAS